MIDSPSDSVASDESPKRSENGQFVIFGANGDLSRRKLLPALYRNHESGQLHEGLRIVGVDRHDETDARFQARAVAALAAVGVSEADAGPFIRRLHYVNIGDSTPADFEALRDRLDTIEREADLPNNRAFYLSLPPAVFTRVLRGLGDVGLNRADGYARLVVEKPFGTDLATAQALNRTVHEYFKERQIYRIDHYLGKDTVQNLLVFRLANALIESSWNRDRIDAVQITVSESLGVGTRAGYYDHAGALRDMVQNHLTQLLTLVAMEVPESFSADAIRYEKLKVLRSITPITTDHAVRGQYTAGVIGEEAVRGYREEEGVDPDSGTETFIALKMFVDTWRWNGVPFYLRTGKRMPRKSTQIAIRFREAPVRFFQSMGCHQDTADVLKITLQPNEGFSLHFDIKIPGSPLQLERVPFAFNYVNHFQSGLPDAYQTLLLDVINGDQTLFVHAEEVEESWRVYAPLLENPPPVVPYPAGSWGPAEAVSYAIQETDLWQSE
ncbi:MAG: glucose-6-phosphate dehydrogenase [Myxococcota bacterium]